MIWIVQRIVKIIPIIQYYSFVYSYKYFKSTKSKVREIPFQFLDKIDFRIFLFYQRTTLLQFDDNSYSRSFSIMAESSIEAKLIATFFLLMAIVLAVNGDHPGNQPPNLKLR